MSHKNDKIKNSRRSQQITATMTIDESIPRQHGRVIFVESN